jgi:hypothetical protein
MKIVAPMIEDCRATQENMNTERQLTTSFNRASSYISSRAQKKNDTKKRKETQKKSKQ